MCGCLGLLFRRLINHGNNIYPYKWDPEATAHERSHNRTFDAKPLGFSMSGLVPQVVYRYVTGYR